MSEAQQAQAEAAVDTQKEGGLLDQIIKETRIDRDEDQRTQSRLQIATLVKEVMQKTITVSEDLEAMINAPRRAPRYGVERLPDSRQTMAGELHRRMKRTGYANQPWQSRLTSEQRDEFRRWGQRTFQLVIEYVAASKRAERPANEAPNTWASSSRPPCATPSVSRPAESWSTTAAW